MQSGDTNNEELSESIVGTERNKVIIGLREGVDYIFEVVGVATVNGSMVMGDRVMAITLSGKCNNNYGRTI